jgi:hypothetical protein
MTAEYTYLFNAITKAIEQLTEMKNELLNAQRQAEEIYLERGD